MYVSITYLLVPSGELFPFVISLNVLLSLCAPLVGVTFIEIASSSRSSRDGLGVEEGK